MKKVCIIIRASFILEILFFIISIDDEMESIFLTIYRKINNALKMEINHLGKNQPVVATAKIFS